MNPITDARLQTSLVAKIAYYNILPYADGERGWSDPDAIQIEKFLLKVKSAKRAVQNVRGALMIARNDGNPAVSGSYCAETFHHVAIRFADSVAWEIVSPLSTDTRIGWEVVAGGIDAELLYERWTEIRQGLAGVSRDIDLPKLCAGINVECLRAEGGRGSETPDDGAYILCGDLWPDRFDTYPKFKNDLDNIDENVIRRRKPNPQRLEIHAGDWFKYWKKFDAQRSDLLDEESAQELIADIEAAKQAAQKKKRKSV